MYTEQMIEALKAGAPWDLDTATDFAEAHPGLTPRSVVAKVGALGLKYIPKTSRAQPAKPAKVSKADLKAEIESMLSMSLPSLDKMNMADMSALLDAIKTDVVPYKT